MSKKPFSFSRLDWDSIFFKTNCGKIVLYETLSEKDWEDVSKLINNYDFVVIQNRNSNYSNSKLIGEKSSAYLIDINIQFQKKIKDALIDIIDYTNGYKESGRLLELTDFSYSRFFEDEKLFDSGGKEIYKEWVKNATLDNNKVFICNINNAGEINGYALVSEKNESIIIELIAVDKQDEEKSIGTKLFKKVESYAWEKNISLIEVGTQVNNIPAVNFYNKMGCKQVAVHQIFHIWND